MRIKLIEGLQWDMAPGGSGGLCNTRGEKVHLRQGDMDGACGPYCLVMAMLARNQLSRRQAKGLERVDSRTRYGRLMEALNRHETLVRVGTTGHDLLALLQEVNDKEHRVVTGSGVEMVHQARAHIERDFPVLLGFHGHKGSDIRHWCLAIGMSDDAFFLLDPAHELQPGLGWNAVLTSQAHGSRFGYRYINVKGTWAVTLKEMLALL
ncbi:hypothetical protein [Pseudomonas tohonis]|jgi:hypothetical protein|uniref:hypothetical protein n=1 Tax=Pseudomonas tohonis TaxID=2725477 RepID=UPI001F1B3258|nr:hypothetical protein [Pseudomonas tohonis]